MTATRVAACPQCRGPLTITVGERVAGVQLVWYQSEHCTSCGFAQEIDGDPPTPPAIRALLLDQEGEWELVIKVVDQRVLRVLRDALHLSPADLHHTRQSSEGFSTAGTYQEIRLWSNRFRKQGVGVTPTRRRTSL